MRQDGGNNNKVRFIGRPGRDQAIGLDDVDASQGGDVGATGDVGDADGSAAAIESAPENHTLDELPAKKASLVSKLMLPVAGVALLGFVGFMVYKELMPSGGAKSIQSANLKAQQAPPVTAAPAAPPPAENNSASVPNDPQQLLALPNGATPPSAAASAPAPAANKAARTPPVQAAAPVSAPQTQTAKSTVPSAVAPTLPTTGAPSPQVAELSAKVDALSNTVKELAATIATLKANSAAPAKAPTAQATAPNKQATSPTSQSTKTAANVGGATQRTPSAPVTDKQEPTTSKPAVEASSTNATPTKAAEKAASESSTTTSKPTNVAKAATVKADDGWGYTLHAVVAGRAWLKANDNTTISVTEGDTISGLGRVKEINPTPGSESVIFTSGAVIR